MPIRPENKHRYPHNWKAISSFVRFVRASSRCECDGRCNSGRHDGSCRERHGHPSLYNGKKIVLTVAHLDHRPERCDPGNLMAMCQSCHLSYDRDHHAETRRANG